MPANRAVLTKVANSAFDKGAMQAIYDLTKEAGMGDFLQDLEGSSMFNNLANMDFTGLGDLGGPSEYFRGGLAGSSDLSGS